MNKIPTTLLGVLIFKSVISLESWAFICVSLCGGFLYSWAKIREARTRK
jgi:GDP-mannose transporter